MSRKRTIFKKILAFLEKMRPIQKILISLHTGKKYLIKEIDDDFHTAEGIISTKDLRSSGVVASSKLKKFVVLTPSFSDFWENLGRGPQIMLQKDIGLVMAKTGLGKESSVVDAGGGSGALCLALANVCKDVYVYEINPEHYDIVAKNVRLCGFTNVHLKQEDIYQGIREKEVDIVTLDLPEPWRVTEHAEKALKEGGFIVVYLPNLNQVKEFINSCRKTRIKVLETVELLERKWKIEEKIMRPEFEMLGHTGFLTFARKM